MSQKELVKFKYILQNNKIKKIKYNSSLLKLLFKRINLHFNNIFLVKIAAQKFFNISIISSPF
jgi:hypothetical protein